MSQPGEGIGDLEGGQLRAFVGGISWRYSSEDLKAVFQKFGAIGAQVMVDKLTQRSRGFGFVTFADEAGLVRAIEEVHGTELDGKVVSVKSALPMNNPGAGYADTDYRSDRAYDRRTYEVHEPHRADVEDHQEHKAFVGGISWQYDSDQLRDVFRKYGPTDAQVITDVTGRSRGFGFVAFRNERSLNQAIHEMDGVELDGKRVSVTRAIPRDQTAPGTPAAALAQGPGRRDNDRYRSYERVPYQRSFERDIDFGYDRQPVLVRTTYDRGYDRRPYSFSGPDRDPYYRDVAVYEYADYDRQPRGYADAGFSRSAYVVDRFRGPDRSMDRGPDRRLYSSRPGPYDRRGRR